MDATSTTIRACHTTRPHSFVHGVFRGLKRDRQGAARAGANKDLTDNRNCTVLPWASGEGNVGIVRLLLEAVADDDVLDYSGRTGFWTAADAGHLEIVPVLLVGGASTEGADKTVARLCGGLLLEVMSRSSTCCWRLLPRTMWQTTTVAQLCERQLMKVIWR